MTMVNYNPKTDHLPRLTDEQRQKGLKKIAENRARRKLYKEQLAQMKDDQLNAAQGRIEAGEIRGPADMLLDMIQNQEIIVNNPELKPDSKQYLAERELLLKMYDRYAALTGANAASAVSIDVTQEVEEEKTPEQIQDELLKYTSKLKLINPSGTTE